MLLANYFKSTWKNLLRHKLFSLINILGLSIGLTAVMLIALFVIDEISYDKWIPNSDKIFRLESTINIPGQQAEHYARTPGKWYESLQNYFGDDIEAVTRIYPQTYDFALKDVETRERVTLVDRGFLEIFDLPMVSGDPSLVFQDYTSIIINEENARKYFGNENPVGQTMPLFSGAWAYKVVAVMKDLPRNTHLEAEMIAWFDPERYIDQPHVAESWVSHNMYQYLRLKNIATAEDVEAKFPSFLDTQLDISNLDMGNIQPSDVLTIDLMALTDIHLHSTGNAQFKPTGNINAVYNFTAIAVLVLVVACINFMNLSTARASLRAKEVAIRKVCGASRRQVATQFLMEALLVTVIAAGIAFVLVELLLPAFSQFIEKILSLNIMSDPVVLVSVLAMIVLVGLGAGAYPSLLLSSFRPAETLKGGKNDRRSAGPLRIIMVTFQFSIAIGLILMTAVMYFQVDFAQNRVPGFAKDNKYMLFRDFPLNTTSSYETVRSEYMNMPQILGVTASNRSLPLSGDQNARVTLLDRSADEIYFIDRLEGDYNYLPFYDAKLLAGRLFSPDYQADMPAPVNNQPNTLRRSSIINESALNYMGFSSPEDALGKTMVLDDINDDDRSLSTIVGVVADTNFASLHAPIRPLIFHVSQEDLFVISMEYDREYRAGLMEAVDSKWMEISGATSPPSSNYLDVRYNFYYQADEERMQTFAFFSSFAIFVACLGLYGLASFEAEQRTKEIGIRKVLGARIKDIVTLLVWQFSKPVLFANIIAWPVAFYFITDWLTGFEYRIGFTDYAYLFLVASIMALLIAWLTVAIHAIRVAQANPVKALRYE